MSETLEQQAVEAGIDLGYHDINGIYHATKPEVLESIVAVLDKSKPDSDGLYLNTMVAHENSEESLQMPSEFHGAEAVVLIDEADECQRTLIVKNTTTQDEALTTGNIKRVYRPTLAQRDNIGVSDGSKVLLGLTRKVAKAQVAVYICSLKTQILPATPMLRWELRQKIALASTLKSLAISNC